MAGTEGTSRTRADRNGDLNNDSMILLRLISWPYARRHLLRTLLTTVGIALGVAVFIGMNAANGSVLSTFALTIGRIAGKTQLQVTAGGMGFAEEVLDTVQSASTVAVAVPVIEAIVDTQIRGEGNLLILGVDLLGDRSLRDYHVEGEHEDIDDPLVFLAQPDSILLARPFAERNNLKPGSRLRLGVADGERPFVIRGVMTPGGMASAFGGNIAVMDIYAAQRMFGRGRSFDRIDVAVAPGRTTEECQRELETLLGPGFQIEPPTTRGRHFEDLLAGYSIMMSVASLFALLVGMLIIYNSFAIAVAERRSEIGILRALGASRTQVRWLFLGESAVTGAVGSAFGLLVGMLIARGMTFAVETLVTDLYGVAQGRSDIVAGPRLLASGLGLGVATSLVAALIPARAAAVIDPVVALQKGRHQSFSRRESRVRAGLAFVLGPAAALCLVVGGSRWTFYASYALAMLAALLLTPALAQRLARLVRLALKWARPVEGALAADSLVQAPRRTSAIVTALMLSVALIISFAGLARTSRGSILGWANTQLDPDLWVMASRTIGVRTIRFPPVMAPELAALPGVNRVQMQREDRAVFRGSPVMITALELSGMVDKTRLQTTGTGNLREMLRQLEADRGVLVSDNLAQLQQLKTGDILELPAPAGVIRLPIVGVVIDYSDQLGTIVLSRTLFQRYWKDDSVNVFRLYLEPGASFPDVKRQILARYAGQRQVFVTSSKELRQYVLGITDQWFTLTYVQVAVAALVAIFGIVNALTVSITDRRRELGILKAVGALNAQVRRTIWIEALAIAVMGIALGWALGAINLYYVLEIVRQDVIGIRLGYEYPTLVAVAVLPMMLAAAFVAAIWPAESSVRGSLVEALEYE